MTTTLADRRATVSDLLEQHDQAQLLTYYDELDEAGQQKLLDQIEAVDWPEVTRLIASHVKNKPTFSLGEKIEAAPAYPAEPTPELKDKYAEARERGEQLIRLGQVAAFVVAGGQGTRLGWDGPKGTYPATPIREASLFQVFAEYLLKLRAKYGAIVPWYVMTSPINHDATVAFFEEHDHFGLGAENVMLFPQAMMPAMQMQTGKCLLAAKDELALSPNGHGGSLKALWTFFTEAERRSPNADASSWLSS